MLLDKILVGTDFTAAAEVAVRHALAIARRANAELVLVHACAALDQSPHVHRGLPKTTRELWRRLRSDLCAANRAKLDGVRAQCRGQGVRVTQMFRVALPDDGILKAAEESEAKLIVLGANDGGEHKTPRLGSVAGSVFQRATVPVMIARPHADPERGFHKILVPTDFSPSSERALATAIALADGAAIELAHFWRPGSLALPRWPASDDATAPDYRLLHDAMVENIENLGNELVSRFDSVDRDLVFSHGENTPGRGIRALLETGDYDLVVIGSHGYRGWRRWILGSVARATARHAPCSVVVAGSSTGESG